MCPHAAASSEIAARLTAVRERIARAADRARRDPAAIRLVAVSKTFGPEHVRAAAAAGQVDFGENKVQEALQKIEATSDLSLRWHLVGHLQSNKARRAAAAFQLIQSVDSEALLVKIDQAAADAGRAVDVLVQVDLAGEATKHGARESDLRPVFDAARACRTARVVGLMLLPPAVTDPQDARPYFRALRGVRDRLLAAGVDRPMLAELSMGMSHDFEVAVEEGATMVRVGTAIFGERTYV
jgi:pyridoxal phosphate enzyme (YggS family)